MTSGEKRVATLLAKDPEYFSKLGKIGGSAKVKKGFALMPRYKAVEAGRKSKRGKSK